MKVDMENYNLIEEQVNGDVEKENIEYLLKEML